MAPDRPTVAAPGAAGRPRRLGRLLQPALAMARRIGLTVSRDDVVWCFRQLLGRDPESDDTILAHQRFFRFRSLVQCIARSPEFAGQQRGMVAATPPAGGAIPAEAFRAVIEDYLRDHAQAQAQRGYVEMHFERLLDTLNIVHRVLPEGGRLLDYSAMGYFSHAVEQLVGRGVTQVNVSGVNYELDDHVERYGAGSYDLCLNTEVLEHLLFDPSRMVHGINRLLRPGGHLLMSTPNAIAMGNALRLMTGNPPTVWNQLNATSSNYFDRHNRDWTPFEVARLLQEHGFEVLEIVTRDYYDDTRKLLARHPAMCRAVLQHSTHAYHGDTQLVLARKLRESPEPVRSSWLYVLPAQSAGAG